MNAAMGNFLPCAHQRDEEEVPCETTKKREEERKRREMRERQCREGEKKEKKGQRKKFSHRQEFHPRMRERDMRWRHKEQEG